MSLRCLPVFARSIHRFGVHLVDALDERLGQNLRGELGARGREQSREEEHAPEDQCGQPQSRIVPQATRSRIKEGAAQIAKLEAGGPVDQVVRLRHQCLQVGDRLARQVVNIGQHQVGASRPVKLTQPQHFGGFQLAPLWRASPGARSSSRHAVSRCASRSATSMESVPPHATGSIYSPMKTR